MHSHPLPPTEKNRPNAQSQQRHDNQAPLGHSWYRGAVRAVTGRRRKSRCPLGNRGEHAYKSSHPSNRMKCHHTLLPLTSPPSFFQFIRGFGKSPQQLFSGYTGLRARFDHSDGGNRPQIYRVVRSCQVPQKAFCNRSEGQIGEIHTENAGEVTMRPRFWRAFRSHASTKPCCQYWFRRFDPLNGYGFFLFFLGALSTACLSADRAGGLGSLPVSARPQTGVMLPLLGPNPRCEGAADGPLTTALVDGGTD